MSFLGVKYVHDKDENFKAFLDQLPIPPEKAEVWLYSKPTSKLEKDGDTYVSTSTTPAGDEKVLKFESGVEFEEDVGDLTATSTITVEDNVLTHVQKFPDDKSITFRKEYQDKELVVSISLTGWDDTAKRYYVAE